MQITDYSQGRRERREVPHPLEARLQQMAAAARVTPAQFAKELIEVAIVDEFRRRFPAPTEPARPGPPAGRMAAAS